MRFTPKMMATLQASKGSKLTWQDFPELGYIPKKAKEVFLEAHRDCSSFEGIVNGCTMFVIAIPKNSESRKEWARLRAWTSD